MVSLVIFLLSFFLTFLSLYNILYQDADVFHSSPTLPISVSVILASFSPPLSGHLLVLPFFHLPFYPSDWPISTFIHPILYPSSKWMICLPSIPLSLLPTSPVLEIYKEQKLKLNIFFNILFQSCYYSVVVELAVCIMHQQWSVLRLDIRITDKDQLCRSR